ncbi:molybdenum cofactor cytidylyltransferase [Mucilaginibacter gracilis]|uniref:Molybdenum cofactor cytidylyltransferase n=1 Tax=Mucilaginibacter gracilis TaxID=423350 RepID=A0A495J7W0_9SPHI|nr:nucleotidyltransferase family protein [Mucilaginibacter gracilis]RKR84831.1 molybdenum cofactor cytidylyltransferase [Mucilaginibacter gracilis]
MTTGIIILAAGSSSRLGEPKQNLIYQGKTLLQHAVSAAIASACRPVIVVLGANAQTIQSQIANQAIQIIHNPNWQQGMASSINAGISHLQKTPNIQGAVIMLCDQPFANHTLINQLLQAHTQSGKGIVASLYNNTQGVPAFFHQKYFHHLLALQGHQGAKKLLTAYADDIATVPFDKGAIDIDTMADYEGLLGE